MPLNQLFSALADVQSTAPDYFSRFEDTDLDTAPRAELVDLIETAPNDQVKFFLFGKLTARVALAGATGRAFL